MGNCATCCGKQDSNEIDTTDKVKQAKLGKSHAGVDAYGRGGMQRKWPKRNYYDEGENHRVSSLSVSSSRISINVDDE